MSEGPKNHEAPEFRAARLADAMADIDSVAEAAVAGVPPAQRLYFALLAIRQRVAMALGGRHPNRSAAAAPEPTGAGWEVSACFPRIVCLCGSGRFKEAFEQAEYQETLAGRIVLTIGCNTKDVARSPELRHYKPRLDQLHLRKIDLSEEILVLNVNGYIGESTRREIAYAIERGRRVRYLEPTGEAREW